MTKPGTIAAYMTPQKGAAVRKPSSVSEKKRRWVVISDGSDTSDQEDNDEDEEPASPYRVTSIFSSFLHRGKAVQPAAPAAPATTATAAVSPPPPKIATASATTLIGDKSKAKADGQKQEERVPVLDLVRDESEGNDVSLSTKLPSKKKRKSNDSAEERTPEAAVEDCCLSMELFSVPDDQPEETRAVEPKPAAPVRRSPDKLLAGRVVEYSQPLDEPLAASLDPLADWSTAPPTNNTAASAAETQGGQPQSSSSSSGKRLSHAALDLDEEAASFDPLRSCSSSVPPAGTHLTLPEWPFLCGLALATLLTLCCPAQQRLRLRRTRWRARRSTLARPSATRCPMLDRISWRSRAVARMTTIARLPSNQAK
jgi:hypothetical protein